MDSFVLFVNVIEWYPDFVNPLREHLDFVDSPFPEGNFLNDPYYVTIQLLFVFSVLLWHCTVVSF